MSGGKLTTDQDYGKLDWTKLDQDAQFNKIDEKCIYTSKNKRLIKKPFANKPF